MGKIAKRYLSYRETASYTGLHFSTIRNMFKAGNFPKPVRLTPQIIKFDRIKVSMVMDGASVEDVEALSQRALMDAYDRGDYPIDQIDPEENDDDTS